MAGYIAVDLETTSLSARHGGRIIEIAAVALADDGLEAEFQSLINPGVPIPVGAQRVHGITADLLQGQPSPEYVITQFRKFIGVDTLIAHNAQFDVNFLKYEFNRFGLDMVNRNICTLSMSRRCLPGLQNYKLATVYRHLFNELPGGRHRALTDARMAGRIWQELIKR